MKGFGAVLLYVLILQQEAHATCPASAVRWASSSRNLYVTGAVDCTLSDLHALLSSDVLQLVDATQKIWLLRGNLILQQGAMLIVHGDAVGGDANELRLRSNDSSSERIYVRAYWGTIDLDSTRVTSWDEGAGGPDTRPDSNGRAFIHVRSFLDADGITPHESRMDIRSSDIGYLGYNAAESYGLVWKVLGTSAGIYDKVDVFGDVTDSRIHHNYFGAYTYGAYGMNWLRNQIDHNRQYGLDPHDDSDALVISDNDVHDNGNHGIICSQRCDHIVISGNRSYGNTGCGIMIHRSVTASIVENNESYDNSDAGLAIFDSSGNQIRGNVFRENDRGIRLSVGSADNLIEGNEIASNSSYGLYFYKGTDTPTSGDGHPKRNLFRDNYIHHNERAVKLKEGDQNQFVENVFEANPKGFLFDAGADNVLDGNVIPADELILTDVSSSMRSNTIITRASTPLLVQGTDGGTATFRETALWTHMVSGQTVATTVTPAAATLVLGSQISSSRTVSAVALFATITSGSMLVTPTSWSSSKTLTARSTTGTLSVQFRVGQLTPNTSYTVRRNGTVIQTIQSDGAGVIVFTDGVGDTTNSYSVQP